MTEEWNSLLHYSRQQSLPIWKRTQETGGTGSTDEWRKVVEAGISPFGLNRKAQEGLSIAEQCQWGSAGSLRAAA